MSVGTICPCDDCPSAHDGTTVVLNVSRIQSPSSNGGSWSGWTTPVSSGSGSQASYEARLFVISVAETHDSRNPNCKSSLYTSPMFISDIVVP